MFRASGLLCACLAAALAGCVFNVGGTRMDVAIKVDEQAVDAKLEVAAAKLQRALEMRGLQVEVTNGPDAVRVVSATRSGDRFTIVLSKQVSPSGKEQTRMRAEWDKAPDKELWVALVVAATATTIR